MPETQPQFEPPPDLAYEPLPEAPTEPPFEPPPEVSSDRLMLDARHEPDDTPSLLPPILGATLAALAGGLIWGLIALTTGREIGWVAWGVGLLAGLGVVKFARGRSGRRLQLVAAGSALLGIAIGKYFAFFHILSQYVEQEYGAEATAELSMFSAGVIRFFGTNLGATLSGYDALWIFLAVSTAWAIPRTDRLAEAIRRA